MDNKQTMDNGWLGRLTLNFKQRQAANQTWRTELIDRSQTGPLTVQKPFYPEGGACHIYLLHPPGGVVGGDRLELNVHLDNNCHLLMTTPGATKFYRTENETAYLQQRFHLSPDSCLEWLPQETILFSGAQADLSNEFILQKGSRLLGWETLCFGRPVMQEQYTLGQLSSQLTIQTPTGIGLEEHLKIIDGDLSAVGQHPYSATLFAYPADETLLHITRQILSHQPLIAGATCLDNLLIVRLLADDNLDCQQRLQQLWRALRPHLFNLPALAPRIWAT